MRFVLESKWKEIMCLSIKMRLTIYQFIIKLTRVHQYSNGSIYFIFLERKIHLLYLFNEERFVKDR